MTSSSRSTSSSYYDDELQEIESELAVIEADLQTLLERQSTLLDKRAELTAIIQQHENQDKQEKDAAFWSKSDFEWSAAIDEKLKSVFHLKELRPMQRQTMNATLSKEDALLIMPTGGGKSLCFQLPSLIKKGLTLVVSPLISLIEDQLMALEQYGVPAAVLNASSTKEETKYVMEDMVNLNGKLCLLYVTPEKLAKSKRFMNKLEKCYAIGHLSRLVIDEVHCCSQWGHDFRPDYKFLGIMKRQFPNIPILGLTATATTKVLEDVKKILSIPKALVLKASFNRPNLFYEIQPKPASQKECVEAIHDLICRKYKNQSGIVYCFSRKDTEELTAALQSLGIKAGYYHGDIDAKRRSMVHSKWLRDEILVVVATIAFGMGIDKPDVRFVIHHSISKSMENLYQESGRAGRDGKRADCIVFYRLADFVRQSSMVFTEQTGLTNLHGIVNYCIDASSCRRALIARYFGEVWHSSQCNEMCDHCHSAGNGVSVDKRDVTRHCIDILSLLDAAARVDQRVTAGKLVDAWYGKGPSALKVKTISAPSMSRDKAERILAHTLTSGFLQEDFHFTAYSTICYLIPGPKAKLLRNKSVKVVLDYTIKTPSKLSTSSSPSSSIVSSASPSSSTLRKTNSDATKKPRLVVINRDKSHFNSSSFPSLSPSSSKDADLCRSRSDTHETKSHQNTSDTQRKKSNLKISLSNNDSEDGCDSITKKQSLSGEEEELNFDDDMKFERKCNARSRKDKMNKSSSKSTNSKSTSSKSLSSKSSSKSTTKSNGSSDASVSVGDNSNKEEFGESLPASNKSDDLCVSGSDSEPTAMLSSNTKPKAKRKRKQIVISDSSDDEEEVCLQKWVKVHSRTASSNNENNENRIKDSFIISDEDSEDDFVK